MWLASFERRWRTVLVAAVIGRPRGLPVVEELDLGEFWSEFDRTAPLHLKLGMRVAAFSICGPLPYLLGNRNWLGRLDRGARDAVLERAEELPFLADLTEVAKVVACLAYFDNDCVQAAARRLS